MGAAYKIHAKGNATFGRGKRTGFLASTSAARGKSVAAIAQVDDHPAGNLNRCLIDQIDIATRSSRSEEATSPVAGLKHHFTGDRTEIRVIDNRAAFPPCFSISRVAGDQFIAAGHVACHRDIHDMAAAPVESTISSLKSAQVEAGISIRNPQADNISAVLAGGGPESLQGSLHIFPIESESPPGRRGAEGEDFVRGSGPYLDRLNGRRHVDVLGNAGNTAEAGFLKRFTRDINHEPPIGRAKAGAGVDISEDRIRA